MHREIVRDRTIPTRALLFDLDDTLISDTMDARAALDETCSGLVADDGERDALVSTVIATARRIWASEHFGGELADELGISAVEALYSDFSTCHERVQTLAATHIAYKRAVWSDALAAHGHEGLTDDIDRLTQTFRAVRGNHVTVYDEVREVLEAVAGSARLGIVTNGPTDLQRLKLAATGFDELFSVVVISGELGQGKPSVAPFIHAMGILDIAPESTTMLGDSLPRDVVGARTAGIGVVRVVRPELDLDHKGDPVEVVQDLRPLLNR